MLTLWDALADQMATNTFPYSLFYLYFSFSIEESDSPLDPKIQADETKIMSFTQDKTQTSPISPASKQESSPIEMKSSLPKPTLPPSPQDAEGSSAESGDSEIEFVFEEPRAPNAGYMSFSKSPSTTSSTTVPSTVPAPSSTLAFAPSPAMQYSILREDVKLSWIVNWLWSPVERKVPKDWPMTPQRVSRRAHSQSKNPQPWLRQLKNQSWLPLHLLRLVRPQPVLLKKRHPPWNTSPAAQPPVRAGQSWRWSILLGRLHQKERRRSSQARRGLWRTTCPPLVVFQV